MFFKDASSPILGVYQSSGRFTKIASQNSDITPAENQRVNEVITGFSKEFLRVMASVYNLSDKIDDYIFPVPRAVTADEPNGNGDNFTHDELTRYSPKHRCQVYSTFRNAPFHVEHMAADPKTARGFLPDVYYNQRNPRDKHVLCVAAIDATKDPALAQGILKGDIDSFSMGCICDSVLCSYSKCRKIAYEDKDLCDHLKFHKRSTIDGELIYEDCLGVEFQELSAVGNPADPKALLQTILKAAGLQKAANVQRKLIVDHLLTKDEQVIVARYFRENIDSLPDAMVHLAEKLF